VDVLFIFDQFPEHDDYREPRPYRGRSDLPPVGVFAGRGPRRPNRIGVTSCAIESVHSRELTVVGLDAVSGTPVIDLKPAMTEFHPRNIKQPEWVSRLMSEYFQPQAGPGGEGPRIHALGTSPRHSTTPPRPRITHHHHPQHKARNLPPQLEQLGQRLPLSLAQFLTPGFASVR
jgi:hypothetical protein